jgi:hypothetical protein
MNDFFQGSEQEEAEVAQKKADMSQSLLGRIHLTRDIKLCSLCFLLFN